jgi:hypothetical protein
MSIQKFIKMAYEAGMDDAYAEYDAGPDVSMDFDTFKDPGYAGFTSQPQKFKGSTWFGNSPDATGMGEDIPELPMPAPEVSLDDLHNNIRLQDFAEIPDDITISDPDQANKLISAGHNYVNQATEIYKYLVAQGMNAKEALEATRNHLSSAFEKYRHQ